MVSGTQARLLQRLLAGDRPSQQRLAEELGLTQGPVSLALKKLRQQGFLKDDRTWAETPHALALKKCLVKNRAASLEWLVDANLPVLTAIQEKPCTAAEAAATTGYSKARVFQVLQRLGTHGLLGRQGKRFTLSRLRPDIREFLAEWRKYSVKELGLPDLANLCWRSGKEAVFSMPLQALPAKGTETGFTRFSAYGIEIFSSEKYFALRKGKRGWNSLPEKALTPQKILVHALKTAETPRERGLCLLYYVKNRAKLARNKEIEGVLAGEEKAGWPRLHDLANMAETYNVSLPMKK